MKKKTRQVKARRLYTDGLPTKPYPCRMLYAKQDGNTPMSVFVLPATPEAVNSYRWTVEQTYLRCEAAEITDPWEIAGLIVTALALVRPTK